MPSFGSETSGIRVLERNMALLQNNSLRVFACHPCIGRKRSSLLSVTGFL
jgi:hypothetical protein